LTAPAWSGSDLAMTSRLIFVNRYFYPDESATSQILTDLCFALARAGRHVTVVSSRQLYEHPGATLSRRETIEGIEVRRVRTTKYGRASVLGRLFDYVSFHFAVFLELLLAVSSGDVVVALTDPPMLSVTAAVVARLKKARLINWLQDLYPEVAAQAGVREAEGLIGVLRRMRNRSLHSADMNVAIGHAMAQRLLTENISVDRVLTISNWSTDTAINPMQGSNPLRDEWSLNDKVVVGHSGNLGTAHDADTLLGAAEELKERNDIAFLIVGGGSRLPALKNEIARRGLTNFVFKPYQPRHQLPISLSLPDIHWLSLRNEFESLIVPSKFYGIAAAGRPMILIGAETGELGRIILKAQCGIVIVPGDCRGLAQTISDLADDPTRRVEMGANARRMLDNDYSMQASIAKWMALLS
jgi:glycosyltransferase involved in cell wall biosynthesis